MQSCLIRENFKKFDILKIVPKLTSDRYKGNNGNIAVVGGSLEYTGAPYYSAIFALYGVFF